MAGVSGATVAEHVSVPVHYVPDFSAVAEQVADAAAPGRRRRHDGRGRRHHARPGDRDGAAVRANRPRRRRRPEGCAVTEPDDDAEATAEPEDDAAADGRDRTDDSEATADDEPADRRRRRDAEEFEGPRRRARREREERRAAQDRAMAIEQARREAKRRAPGQPGRRVQNAARGRGSGPEGGAVDGG